MKIQTMLLAAAVAVSSAGARADEAADVPPRKVALVVQNHAAPGAQIPMMALTDAPARTVRAVAVRDSRLRPARKRITPRSCRARG